ncbi:unnamed protein product [Musa acuminata subsp. malaccensis]|uniref:(wild Malaysian banana) hypothetical protein n=1 Tax=Musa acuminata subsp. malaccensis TaxID=214687 RepID=A0A804KYS5_MUSAM|nr:PREDICTED: uncharacterized protein LOC103968875 [Musa acuminata subsp. malaccensis]CAG1854220.1 unnamed protein product [Musa acuminata subsp. malaccensis]
MGNKMGRRRQVVDEKYTRPQGLYVLKDIDHKKLRKLILESKLAPCYPGLEDYSFTLEECPICFLYYPSLNRSRCCMKGICTECFLQMKPPHSTRPTQCPFCKTSNYAVEYRGAKTKEEKGMEQVEEQKVIEAQIRIRQKEIQDEAERMNKRQSISSSSRIMTPTDVRYHDTYDTSISVPPLKCTRQSIDFGSSQASCSAPATTRFSQMRQNRDDNFDLDLEDIMVMEAIWLSIQEQGSQGNPGCGGSSLPGPSTSGEWYNLHRTAPAKLSSSGGLACAAAALAERQHMNGDAAATNAAAVLRDGGSELPREEFGECSTDQWSEVAEAGTSYAGSDGMVEAGAAAMSLSEGTNMASGLSVPESFDEQMMLAMAVSLAEAQARTSSHGVSWQ